MHSRRTKNGPLTRAVSSFDLDGQSADRVAERADSLAWRDGHGEPSRPARRDRSHGRVLRRHDLSVSVEKLDMNGHALLLLRLVRDTA